MMEVISEGENDPLKWEKADCGATTHILQDKSNFVFFYVNFDLDSHIIELAQVWLEFEARGDA